jgi:ribosome-interacting GTPase 1
LWNFLLQLKVLHNQSSVFVFLDIFLLIVKENSTIRDVCNKIHRKFVKDFRYAVISGPSAKYDNQRVGLDHIVKEGDVVTIIVNKASRK